MSLTRRSFLILVGAGTAAGVTAGGTFGAVPSEAASPAGDVVGKITVGYQGWFACIGDSAPINGWWHWSQNWGQPPSPSNNAIKAWPDMREYTAGYQTAYGSLNGGGAATLFSSYDQQSVNTHFLWMQQNGCDTAALQRFNPNSSEGPTRDAMAVKVRSAAEANGRKFYIMYDVSGWTNMQPEIKTDWISKMSAHTASSAYARQNGKPVVCIWGFGFNDSNHPWDAATCLDVVNWVKAQGCYVIGGVPREWRTGTGGSRAGYLGVYHAFNMLSPWMVGAIGTAADSDSVFQSFNVPDQADCNANGIDYQPCVLPGDISARQRVHGDFMWRQFYNMVRVGAQGIYISMFDEYGEGNQIAKTAEAQRHYRPACSRQHHVRHRGQRRCLPADRQPHRDRHLGDLPAHPQLQRHGQPARPGQQHVRHRGQRGRLPADRQPHRDRHLGAVGPHHQLKDPAGWPGNGRTGSAGMAARRRRPLDRPRELGHAAE